MNAASHATAEGARSGRSRSPSQPQLTFESHATLAARAIVSVSCRHRPPAPARPARREREAFAPRTRARPPPTQAARPHLLGGVPMTWMNIAAGGFPLYLDHAHAAPGSPTSTATSTSTSRSATPARWPATRRPPPSRRSPGSVAQGGITAMMPTEDAAWVGAGAGAPLRAAAVVVHAHGDRRQPLGDPARPPGHEALRRSSSTPGATTAASTSRSRCSAPTAPWPRPGNVGPPVDARRRPPASPSSTTPDAARARARARGRRRRADGAGADQHRHRPAGARLPRRGAPAHARARHAAHQRRDAHLQRRPGRRHRAPGTSSPDIVTIGKAIAGGVPSGAFGISAELAERIAADARRRPRRHRRRRRHAGRQRARRSRPPGPRSSTSSPTRRSPA